MSPLELAAPEDTTLSRDPLLGTVLGEYKVTGRIGSGGMGVVYEGIQPQIGKRVAIKVLRWEMASDPEQMERLLAEARAVNDIRHRGIVDIFGSGKLEDGRQYLVMELLEGQPLDRVIADQAPMRAEAVIPILDEILDALAAANGTGVIHRDLKPNNVFIVEPPHGAKYVKLLDFGLAKRALSPGGMTPQTNVSSVVGTPFYMAPEQARGGLVGPQTDLYAAGCMAFEMLTGRVPFQAPTPYEVVTLHLQVEPPRASSLERSVPSDLDDLVLRLMQKDPAQRPESAELVRQELRHIQKRLEKDETRRVPQARLGITREPPRLSPTPRTVDLAQVGIQEQTRPGDATPAPRTVEPAPVEVSKPPPRMDATRLLTTEPARPPRRVTPVVGGVGALLMAAILGAAILWPRSGRHDSPTVEPGATSSGTQSPGKQPTASPAAVAEVPRPLPKSSVPAPGSSAAPPGDAAGTATEPAVRPVRKGPQPKVALVETPVRPDGERKAPAVKRPRPLRSAQEGPTRLGLLTRIQKYRVALRAPGKAHGTGEFTLLEGLEKEARGAKDPAILKDIEDQLDEFERQYVGPK